VWVVCEASDGALVTVSAELLAKAREIAGTLGGRPVAVVLGHDVDDLVRETMDFGPSRVLVVDDPHLASYATLPYARALHDVMVDRRPEVVLFGATTTGRDLAPRVAAMLDTGLAADCTDLYIADWTWRGVVHQDLLHQVRPAMSGGVLATCVCPETRPQMATVRPGVFAAIEHPAAAPVESVALRLQPEDLAVRLIDVSVETAATSIADASVIVAGGAGCSAPSWHLVEELAEALGGDVAASRGAVEAGLAPRRLQVGQTGATVRPDIYVACGISGAFQHVVGMKAARTVVAINRDVDAPIFQFAHFGIVGDVAEVLPRLTDLLRPRRADLMADRRLDSRRELDRD
jgi:electron transfer flavoprotein alpha subunit